MGNGTARNSIRQALEAEAGPDVWLSLLEEMTRDRDELDRLIDLVRTWLDAELSRSEGAMGAPSREALDRLDRIIEEQSK